MKLLLLQKVIKRLSLTNYISMQLNQWELICSRCLNRKCMEKYMEKIINFFFSLIRSMILKGIWSAGCISLQWSRNLGSSCSLTRMYTRNKWPIQVFSVAWSTLISASFASLVWWVVSADVNVHLSSRGIKKVQNNHHQCQNSNIRDPNAIFINTKTRHLSSMISGEESCSGQNNVGCTMCTV